MVANRLRSWPLDANTSASEFAKGSQNEVKIQASN
jgi:hypothetical protein